MRIVGDGWWRHRVEEHVREVGLDGAVTFLGYVDEVTKHRELSRAGRPRPERQGGLGLNVVEAASHGVPTVAHHGAGGLSESIVDGRTGVLVDDVTGMARETARLLRNDATRAVMGERAREHAALHSWKAPSSPGSACSSAWSHAAFAGCPVGQQREAASA